MTVNEMLQMKYREWLKNMSEHEWEVISAKAEAAKMSIPDYMMLCLEITHNDIKQNGWYGGEFYRELDEMHKNKLVASNKHRQEHGHVTKYWLTKKGLKAFNAAVNA